MSWFSGEGLSRVVPVTYADGEGGGSGTWRAHSTTLVTCERNFLTDGSISGESSRV